MATDVDVRDLDALEAAIAVQRESLPRRFVGTVGPPLIAVAVLVGIWAILALAHLKVGYVALPSPGEVASSLRHEFATGDGWRVLYGSVHRAIIGFLIAVVIGTPLGVAVGRVRWLRASLHPLISGLQSLPSVAWVPPAIIVFGLTPKTIYTVVLLGAVPSICNGTISGLDQVPPLNIRVGRVLGARGLTLARLVLMPSVLPTYISGLKQGWAFAWRSLMAAEIITQSPSLGRGLGQLLNQGQENLDLSLELAAILLILFVGVVIEMGVFGPLERRVLRNRGLTSA